MSDEVLKRLMKKIDEKIKFLKKDEEYWWFFLKEDGEKRKLEKAFDDLLEIENTRGWREALEWVENVIRKEKKRGDEPCKS